MILLRKQRLATIKKGEMNFVLRKKTLHNEKKGIIVFCEIFSQ